MEGGQPVTRGGVTRGGMDVVSNAQLGAVTDTQAKDRLWQTGVQERQPDSPGLRLPSISILQVDTRGERLAACPSAPSHHSRLQKLSSLTGWSEG